MKKIFIGEIK